MSYNCKNKDNLTDSTHNNIIKCDKNKKCVKANICLFKTLLNRCIVEDPNMLITTFDITLINKMSEKVINVSLIDALVAIKYACPDMKIEVLSLNKSLIPLSSEDILKNNGELLNVEKSFLPARSACRLLIKVSVKQEIECDDEILDCDVNICHNPITLNGIIREINENECICIDKKIEPLTVCSKGYSGKNFC